MIILTMYCNMLLFAYSQNVFLMQINNWHLSNMHNVYTYHSIVNYHTVI